MSNIRHQYIALSLAAVLHNSRNEDLQAEQVYDQLDILSEELNASELADELDLLSFLAVAVEYRDMIETRYALDSGELRRLYARGTRQFLLNDRQQFLNRTMEQNAMVNAIAGNLQPQNHFQVIPNARRQCAIIAEELRELAAAVDAQNIQGIRDGLADVTVTVDGLIYLTFPAKAPVTYRHVESNNAGRMQERLRKLPIQIDPQNLENDAYNSYYSASLNALAYVCDAVNRCEDLQASQTADLQDFIGDFAIAAYSMVFDLSVIFKIDLEADHNAVFESNLSKFDTDRETAEKGVDMYSSRGVNTEIVESTVNGTTYYVIKSSADQVVNGKSYPKGKFLKSINFCEPKFT